MCARPLGICFVLEVGSSQGDICGPKAYHAFNEWGQTSLELQPIYPKELAILLSG